MRRDMTQGSIWKHLLFFALPLMFGNLLQQLYSTVDGIVVGNFVSQNALAAVGSCTSLCFLFLAISIGMSTGGGVMIAQYFGAGHMEDMRRAAATLLILLLIMGVVLTVIGTVFAQFLISNFMQVEDPSILEMSVTYFFVYSCGLIFQYIYNAISSILRALGDSKATLYFLCVAAVLNIILDLLFVIAFNWDVFGVAFATVLSQVACAAVSLLYMLKRYPMFRFKKQEFVFDIEMLKPMLRLGIPATIQQAVLSLGNVLIQRLVNGFGGNTMAAFTVGNRIENYSLLPVLSINAAAATFTGQNVGAGKYDRVKRGFLTATLMSFIITVALCPFLYFFAGPLSQLFGTEGEGLRQSVQMIHFMSTVFFIFAIYNPSVGVLQGAGDAMWSTASTLTTLSIRVILAYVLVYGIGFDHRAAWVTMPVGWAIAACVSFSRFFRGKWKTKGVVKRQAPIEEVDA